MFIAGHPNSVAVLSRVWALDKELLQSAMIDVHRKEPSLSSNMLNVIQELRVLPQILETKPAGYLFAIELATLASGREFLNLEKWVSSPRLLCLFVLFNLFPFPFLFASSFQLNDHIQTQKGPFLKSCLEMLSRRGLQPAITAESVTVFSADTIAIFLRILKNNAK